jgi:hypothetical protein
MRNAILALIGLFVLLIWIFTAENRQALDDPRIKWKSSTEATHSGNPEKSTDKIVIPISDPNLRGCFSGSIQEGPLTGTQFSLVFSSPSEIERSDRYRLIQIQGGFRKVRDIPKNTLTKRPSKPGFTSGYQLPIPPSGFLELYFNSEAQSWSARLKLNARPENREPPLLFTLFRTESCL